MPKKNDEKEVTTQASEEELKNIAKEGDVPTTDEVKPKRKRRAVKKKDTGIADETITQYSKMFVPVVSVTFNTIFKRLKWEKLSKDEEVLLSDGITKVGAKYLPTMFEKYAEEFNLALVLGTILATRMLPRINPGPEIEEIPLGI